MKRKLILLIFLGLLIPSYIQAKGKSTNYRNSISFAYSPVNSVFEDDNLILQIFEGKLWAKNKTEKTIFIDLSQCFLINNGASYPMYSSASDEKHASKAKYSSDDEFLSIAPATGNNQNETYIATLDTRIYGKYSANESPSENFSDYERRFLSLIDEMLNESLEADPKGKQYLGSVSRHLTEDESISNIGASIAYAFNKRAENWTNVTISTWVADVIFAPYYNEIPKARSKKEKKGFSVKDTEAVKIHIKADSPFEFDADKSPIIVADWEGNFKKGTFELKPIVTQRGGMSAGRALAGMFTGGLAWIGAKPLEEMKSSLFYDGLNNDWGKMSYMPVYGKTSQSN